MVNSSNKVYRQVLDYLIENIKNGKIKRGTKIKTERELSETLGVSREAIREAIRILEIVGLVEKRPRYGTQIKEEFDEWIMEPMAIIFKLTNVGPKEVYEFRKMIEVEIAALAAKRITDSEINELSYIYYKMINSEDEVERALYDKKFHHLIARASKNKIIINAYNAMSPMLDLFTIDIRSVVVKNENDTILEDMHVTVFESIVRRDENGARLSMENHMDIINRNFDRISSHKIKM